jgi:hypothetical protein
VSEVRREELARGIQTWEEHGGSELLLTLTHSHTPEQRLSDLLAGQRKAYKRFCENQRVCALMRRLGVRHKVRGLEVTFGANGWHPHLHVLLLTSAPVSDFGQVRDELAALWIECCKKSGLNSPSMAHGLDLRDGKYAKKYVSKWGLESELTKGHIKKGNKGGMTPFDILNWSMVDTKILGRSPASLWQEFAAATKGQRQLVWSRGLKALLGVADVTDEEAAQQTEKEAFEVREVESFVFALLVAYQQRHTFLECIERDYKDGCLGKGSAERLLIALLEQDLKLAG